MSVTHVYEKYGTSLTVQGKTSNGLQVRIAREGKPARVATWGAIPLKRDMQATLEERPPQVESKRPELVQRLLADFCDLCGSEEDVQVHHERAMRKLHEHEGRPKAQGVKRMIALRRKTVRKGLHKSSTSLAAYSPQWSHGRVRLRLTYKAACLGMEVYLQEEAY